jgi:fatty-acyl-CoA synthase
MVQAEQLRVVDNGMNDVPGDGETMREIGLRRNNVMKGYFEDDGATDEASGETGFTRATSGSCTAAAMCG